MPTLGRGSYGDLYTLKLYQPNKNKRSKKGKQEDKPSSLLNVQMSFNSPYPEYKAEIMMKSDDMEDIRIIAMTFKITPPPKHFAIEIKCPAGKKISQKIPIANNYQKDVEVTSSYTKDDKIGHWFTFPAKAKVNASVKEGSYEIAFFPLSQ